MSNYEEADAANNQKAYPSIHNAFNILEQPDNGNRTSQVQQPQKASITC